MIASPADASRDQLTGWKEIASYLGKSVRTVQRWEQRYELPVHRVPGSADVVLASKEEIERWKRSEASLDILDLDREDGPPGIQTNAAGSRRTRQPSPRLVIAAGLAVLAFVLVAIHLSRLPSLVNQAAAEDDDALFEGRPYALQWKSMEDQQTQQRVADALLVDPGFVTVEPGAVVFDYVKRGGQARARPYAFARLQPPPESPRRNSTPCSRSAASTRSRNAASGSRSTSVKA